MNKLKFILVVFCFLCIFSALSFRAGAQCGTTVSTFPYAEDFETGQGGWASGGTGNDWAWGTPAKSAITGAGSGTKCWVTGGLTGDFYNYGERSYVTSPCFDFSNLQYPMINFLIFWDSEHTWDGMTLQSSINGGTTWVNVGAYGDSVNCENQNWYNTVTCAGESGLVTVENAWTGNNLATSGSCQGGDGSLQWVNAKHCLTGLGRQASVMFRFAFGAGTTCNDFNGIAFDSVGIGESPIITDSFTTTCAASQKVEFTGITSECPNSFAWNFGDPSSGSANTSTTVNTAHTFSAPGSYTVTFTASGPCNAPATYTHVVNVIGATNSLQQVKCFNQNTGSISLTVTGGVTPYTYQWANGATTSSISGLTAGTYPVTVTVPQGCSLIDTFTITQPPVLTVSDVSANGTCTAGGTITLTVSGGTPGYTYNWGGGITTQNLSGLSSGTYTVTVTDANSCTSTASASISVSSNLVATATATNVSCYNAANGSINLTVTGGTPPYTYNWGGGITAQNPANLSPGNYTVTVTDHGGCTATATAAITQPNSALTVTLDSTNATCTVGGTITTTVTGGTPGYTYRWNGGIISQNRTGLGAGTYTVTVTDLNSCTVTASAAISSASTIQITPAVTNVGCNGGSNGAISITATGGTGGYSYNWGAGVISQNRSGLTAGNYDITVTDNSNCTASAAITVSQPAILGILATADSVSCNGGTNGKVSITDTGGTAPYTYNWGGGITSQNRNNINAGTYTVTVTDNNGCTTGASATVFQPLPLVVTDSVSNVQCFASNTGFIVAKVTGGNVPYTYNWGTGPVSNPVYSGLSANAYSVTVTDSKGCTASATSTLTQPTQLMASASATVTACNTPTGTVTLTLSGGNSNSYTFNWSNSATTQNISQLATGTYTVTVVNGSGCTVTASAQVAQISSPAITLVATPDSCSGYSDGVINSTVTGGTPGYTYVWSNNQISGSLSGLSAGIYTVTVFDANHCSAVASDSVTSPLPVAVTLNQTNEPCYGDTGGAIHAVVSGGTPAYYYQWSNADSTAIITGLAANVYSVTVNDQNSCSATSSVTISQPVKMEVSNIIDSTMCGLPDGTAQLSVTGGSGPYTYAWLPDVSDSSSATGLGAVHYQVTVSDSAGCSLIDTFTVYAKNIVVEHPYLGRDTSICPGNGTIVLNAGVFQSYFWQDSSTKQFFTVTDSGLYWVVVTDSNGCKSADSVAVADSCSTQLAMPNAFTPNGDGKNDFFLPFYVDPPEQFTIHIYNRWGQLVFQSDKATSGWDGKLNGKEQPIGTYIYYAWYTYTGQPEKKLYGALELLR